MIFRQNSSHWHSQTLNATNSCYSQKLRALIFPQHYEVFPSQRTKVRKSKSKCRKSKLRKSKCRSSLVLLLQNGPKAKTYRNWTTSAHISVVPISRIPWWLHKESEQYLPPFPWQSQWQWCLAHKSECLSGNKLKKNGQIHLVETWSLRVFIDLTIF